MTATATDLFKAGQLQPAIDAQIQVVKAHPADHPARLFLYELFLFSGDVDRARKQIDMLTTEDPATQAAITLYKFAVEAEAARRQVFAGKGQPKSLTVAPDHVFKRLDAIGKLAAGDAAGAAALVAEANAMAPGVAGVLNGKPVAGLRDADDLLGPVIEVFGAGGSYCWVALDQVESLTVTAPRFPRDVLLLPAALSIKDGPSGDVLLPGLYPGTEASPDDALKLGRATDWVDGEGGLVRGLGGKLFFTADGQLPLLDWRVFLAPDDAGQAGA